MNNEYLNKIKIIIEDKAGVEPSDIHETSFFEDDLNIGEMELLEIFQEVEEEFHVELMDRREEIETVQDLVDILTEEIE